MSVEKLRRELFDDPLAKDYVGMADDATRLASLVAVNRPKPNIETLQSAEIYGVIERVEFNALVSSEKLELQILLGLGSGIDVTAGSKAYGALAGMFGPGTATRAALLALTQGLFQSRVEELGIRSDIDEDMIASCMATSP